MPLVNLRAHYNRYREEFEEAIGRVCASGHYILGESVREFEQAAAEYLGVRHAIGVGSGTDALYLALRGAGIKEGDEVITTPYTFVATVETILRVRARPVFADIDPESFNIDPDSIRRVLTPRTRAILPVHMFGLAADMTTIQAIADENDLLVIEDCAQAFGASVGNRRVGSIGSAGCFSFYPSKILGCFGDGGMVTTDSDELATEVRALRNHGNDGTLNRGTLGLNSRLDEVQAAVLTVKLRHLDEIVAARRRAAGWYHEQLADSGVVVPGDVDGQTHVFNYYTILSPKREALARKLKDRAISYAIYYDKPLYMLPFWTFDRGHDTAPRCEAITDKCISLPICPEISRDEVREVAQLVRAHGC